MITIPITAIVVMIAIAVLAIGIVMCNTIGCHSSFGFGWSPDLSGVLVVLLGLLILFAWGMMKLGAWLL